LRRKYKKEEQRFLNK
jgi:hypothetical protein